MRGEVNKGRYFLLVIAYLLILQLSNYKQKKTLRKR